MEFTSSINTAPPVLAFSGTVQPVEGEDHTVSSTAYHPGNPPESSVSLIYKESVLTNGSDIVVLLNSTTLSVVFSSVYRNKSGMYDVTLSNSVGNSTANFTLDVVCECTPSSIDVL